MKMLNHRRGTILYVANSSKIGGGNRSFMELIARLDAERYRPVLVAPTPGPLADWAVAQNIPCHVVPAADWHGRRGLVVRTMQLTRLIVAERAGIVHAVAPTCFRAAGVAARITGVSSICHLGYPPEPGELEWSFRAATPDVVIACHDGQARDVAATVTRVASSARLVSVPNGIDIWRFAPPEPEATLPAWHPRRPVVLIVGHLSEVKGYPTFLRAAARVLAMGDDCSFAALGGETACPGYGAVLEQLVQTLGIAERVKFLGWQSDVAATLRFADIVVMPSRAEGLPMALLEAMACARPVVATPVGGIPEAVTDGVTGLIVPTDDEQALAAAISRLLRDNRLAAALGERARSRVVSDFSLTGMVSGIEAIYASLLKSRGAVA
jgi:glycosyltransferase involved in cell wall biosynthesis